MILSFECSNIPAALTYGVCLSVDMILQVFFYRGTTTSKEAAGPIVRSCQVEVVALKALRSTA